MAQQVIAHFTSNSTPTSTTMTQSDSSLSTATCARVSRRRSLSEPQSPGCNPQSENDEDEHQRSKSESVICSVICTAQGVKFQDKYHKYQTRLDNLVALAANPASSNSNALLAKKALRYRNKTIERRRGSN